MPRETPVTRRICAASMGMSERVRKPCAMVPPKGLAATRDGSVWIHCRSPVSAANSSTSRCVTGRQSLTPS